jgi:hypothetical protein
MLATVKMGGLGMDRPVLLRLYRKYIGQIGMVRFEQPAQTVYAAPSSSLLLRQQKAMKLLRHLDVTPPPDEIKQMRGLRVMRVDHPDLTDFMSVWRKEHREGRIELIRRLGATLGMVHSLRNSGTGDIINPTPRPVGQRLMGLIRKNHVLLRLHGRTSSFPGLLGLGQEVKNLWGNSGGTLAGNWSGFPPVKIWENGLMIMDLSRANYSEPLVDLVNIRPQLIGLEDVNFFWEYFLQGYCATCELPAAWKQKIEFLYRIRLLQAVVAERGQKCAQEDWQLKWWEKL